MRGTRSTLTGTESRVRGKPAVAEDNRRGEGLMRGRQRALSGRLSRVAIGVAAALLLSVLVAFAIVLINQQRGDRNDIKDNFRDRATVRAALTQSLFEASSTASQTENARRFGT